MKTDNFQFLLITTLLSAASIILEQFKLNSLTIIFSMSVDLALIAVLFLELIRAYRKSRLKSIFFRVNSLKIIFLILFIPLAVYGKVLFLSGSRLGRYLPPAALIVLRNIIILAILAARMRAFGKVLKRAAASPSRYIVLSFAVVIAIGTVVFLLPISRSGGGGLNFMQSFFTATSAVCVTGLSVIDVSAELSAFGQGALLALIQVGGLGIMILSFFAVFSIARRLSVENKYMLSYLLSEDDMAMLGSAVTKIIIITFSAELIGTALLFISFRDICSNVQDRIFFAVFHSVSAFCNAGFSLFSDSLEGFSGNILANLTVCGLIIAGALGFSALSELFSSMKIVKSKGFGSVLKRKKERFSPNSRLVFNWTFFLIFSGFLLIFIFEFSSSFLGRGTGEKLLASLFQSVTLRTAGFNTVPIGTLSVPLVLLMMAYMFIGGASGGTAGGIKINTAAVLKSYVVSRLAGSGTTRYSSKLSIPERTARDAFLLFLFGIIAIFCGTIIIAAVEDFQLTDILFEAVSAFATVGLSRGITADTGTISRIVLILLMFLGRVGPLTIFAAASRPVEDKRIELPAAEILVG